MKHEKALHSIISHMRSMRTLRFAGALACASALQMPMKMTRSAPGRAESPRMIGSLFDILGGGGGGGPALIDPADALPGRKEKMQINDRHRVLGTKMDAVPEGHKVAVFANGCFWGSEKGIWRFPGELTEPAPDP